jgi:predicted lipoprotein with Yx(FWY)xxD motif
MAAVRWGLVVLITGGLGFAGGMALAASSPPAANPPVRVQMTEEGPVFATLQGMTLYSFGDQRGAVRAGQRAGSQCSGRRGAEPPRRPQIDDPDPGPPPRRSCAERSPPLLADQNAVPGGDWSLVVRDDGARQWAYRGRPLYTSDKDRQPGDVNAWGGGLGEALQPALLPVPLPAGIRLMRRPEGLVLADEKEQPLYIAARHGAHTGTFRPFEAPLLAKATIEKLGPDWSVVGNDAGVLQYAFRGRLLFLVPDDAEPSILTQSEMVTAVWRTAPPPPAGIGTRNTIANEVYTTSSGMTLYAFACVDRHNLACDEPGDPAVYWSMVCGDAKECARRWRPYSPSPGSRPGGPWSIVEVAVPMFDDGAGVTYPPDARRIRDWAYRGRPVYTYVGDHQPGDVNGHGSYIFGVSGFFALRTPGQWLLADY